MGVKARSNPRSAAPGHRSSARGRPTLALLGLLLALAPPWAPADPSPGERLAAVRERIAQLEQLLGETRTRKRDLEHGLRDIEKDIGALSGELRRLDARLADGQRELEASERRRAALRASLGEQREILAAQIRAAYAMGRQEQIKLLLNQQDPAGMGRTLVYYDYFHRARAEQIAAVRATLAELDAVELRIAEQNAELQGLRNRRAAERDALAAGRETRRRLVARLDRELADTGQQIATLREDEQRLVQLLESLARSAGLPTGEAAERTSFAKLKGRLPWPVQGRVIGRFGAARGVGKLRWQGLLIGAREGGEVQAISHGRVAFADWLRGFGLLLIIDHGDGYMSLYGHNQSLLKETGDWVEPGELIATVGSSGGQENPGLYFEIRQAGQPVNPQAWFTRG